MYDAREYEFGVFVGRERDRGPECANLAGKDIPARSCKGGRVPVSERHFCPCKRADRGYSAKPISWLKICGMA